MTTVDVECGTWIANIGTVGIEFEPFELSCLWELNGY